MQGKIIRGIGGFYYVHTHQGVYECRARGIFRKDKEKPLPGDLVSISVLDETEKKGNLDEILPRTNSLIRPAVANVDQALVIFALVSPKPNFNLLDRFLVLMEKQGIPALICMNKTDLASDEMIAEVRERYRTSGYPLLFVSAAQKEGIEAIREYLRGKTTTVAGPSGVGKSSLINLLQDGVQGGGIDGGCRLVIKGECRAGLQGFHTAGHQTVADRNGDHCDQGKAQDQDQYHAADTALFFAGRCHRERLLLLRIRTRT